MNQHSGELTQLIMVAAGSPTGLRTDSIPGYSTHQVGRLVQKLCARGELFVAKLSHRNARYFSTWEAAKALSAAKEAPVSVRKRLVPTSAWADMKPINLDDIKTTECPAFEDTRFQPAPEDTSWKLFSACKPGEYPAPPSGWAAAVLAGRVA